MRSERQPGDDPLTSAVELLEELPATLVHLVEPFVDRVIHDADRLSVLREAYEHIVEHNLQNELVRITLDRDADRRDGFIKLIVVLATLGGRGVEPFYAFEAHPQTRQLKRAKHIPAEIRPFVDFGAELNTTTEELARLERMDSMTPEEISRLLAFKAKLDRDGGFGDEIIAWLNEEQGSIDAECVDHVLYMIGAVDWYWAAE